MKIYSYSNELAKIKPMQAMVNTTRVVMKGHLLPTISLRKPTGMIVEATSTPMKKHAPRKPILVLLSQSMSAWFYQLSIYWESSVSALYSSLERPLEQMYCLSQLCHSPVSLSLQVKCCGALFIKGRPRMRKLQEFKARTAMKIINNWNILLLQFLVFGPPIVLLIAWL